MDTFEILRWSLHSGCILSLGILMEINLPSLMSPYIEVILSYYMRGIRNLKSVWRQLQLCKKHDTGSLYAKHRRISLQISSRYNL